jgi:serine/threonine-protein kinase
MMLSCPHCKGAVVMPNKDFHPGEIIGGFEIINILGKGGMGYVYLAKQSSMQRLVALKVVMKAVVGTTDSSIIDMFNKEIQLSGKLNHSNIIKAIDAGETESCYFMAITYVDGEDFEKVLDRGEIISEKEAFEVALKMADALNYAWEKHGLIHKDVKPGNIMKDKKGEVFLMDMGIAQHMVLGGPQIEKEVLGSPFYMSPEQGQGFPLDWRTDMYSLGATLYHMIVGVPAYDAKEVTRIIEKHITEPFPAPIDRNPNIKTGKSTVAILSKMMAKKPEDRYRSWEEFDQAAKKAFLTMGKSPGKKVAGNAKSAVKTPIQIKPYKGMKKTAETRSIAGTVVAIVNSIILIAIASLAAYFIYDYRKNSSAAQTLKTAEQYYLTKPIDFEESLRLFSIAKETSNGTKYYSYACRQYDDITVKANDFKIRANNFDDTFKKARILFLSKKFQESIELMIPVKEIEDPVRKEDAERFIVQVRAAGAKIQPPKGK